MTSSGSATVISGATSMPTLTSALAGVTSAKAPPIRATAASCAASALFLKGLPNIGLIVRRLSPARRTRHR